MTPSDRMVDVLVVGAGPAGSATAAQLAGRGFSVALWERARFPRPKPCAEYLSPGSVAALERLGALPDVLREAPARLSGMRVVAPDGAAFTGRFRSGVGLAVPRERLDQQLARFAERNGAALREGVALEGFVVNHGVVSVRGRRDGHPETANARLLIGADGLNSRVARQWGLSRRARLRRVALVAHASGITGLTDLGELHVRDGAYVGLAPLGGGVANVALVVDLARGVIRPPVTHAFRGWLASFPTLRGRVEAAELVSPLRGVGPFGRTTRRATADRTLLVGDAADFYDPFTGEGVYAALRGAELAADRAARALRDDRLTAADLAPYDVARRTSFAAKWTLERIVSWVIARPRVLSHIARRMSRESELAHELVSVTAHVAPAASVFRPSYVWRLAH
jgi:geranylgeranyl reductase family protein